MGAEHVTDEGIELRPVRYGEQGITAAEAGRRTQVLMDLMLRDVPKHKRPHAAAEVRGTFAYQQAAMGDSITALGRAMRDTLPAWLRRGLR